MKKVIASASLLAIGAAGVASLATAQDNGGTTGNPQKPWSISATLRGFYDSNPNTAPDGSVGKVDSWGVELRPGASVNFDWGATKLQASYLYDNRYFFERRNTDQSHDFELNFDHSINERYSFNFSDSFVIAQEPDIISSGAIAQPIRDNGNNLRNTASLNFRAQLTPLFGLVLGYANTVYDYQQDHGNALIPSSPSFSALLDRDENQITLDTTWQIAPETTGIIGYAFGAVFYSSPESILNDGAPPTAGYPYAGEPYYLAASTRNNVSHTFYVGADHSFLPDLTGSVRVGMEYLDYYNDVNTAAQNPITFQFPSAPSSSWSPYADLSLNYTYVDGAVKFGFKYSHNQTDVSANTGNLGAGITEDEASAVVYANVSQKLTPISPRLTGTLSADYQNSVFNQGPVNGENDNYWLFGLNLNYKFNQFLFAETGYNYDLVSSDISGRGYNRSQVYLGVGLTY